MDTADRILALKLVTDVGDINKQMKGATAGFKKMGSAAKSWGKAIGGAFILSGISALPGLVSDLHAGFKQGEDAARNLGHTWKNLGLNAKGLGNAIDKVSGMAVDMGFDDAELVAAFDLFLGKTGDVKESMRATRLAMDLVRAKGWNLGKAVKYISANLGDLDEDMKINRNKARAWARHHPLEVTAGKITAAFEDVIGNLAKGKWEKAFEALAPVGGFIEDLLFGKKQKITLNGERITVRTGGLIDRFAGIGRQLIDGIIVGLEDLGPKVLTFWDKEIASVDWGKAISDALGGAMDALTAEPDKSGKVLAAGSAIGGILLTGLFAAKAFSAALSVVMAAPGFLIGLGVEAAGNTLGLLFRKGMFAAEMLGRGLKAALSTIGADKLILDLAQATGRAIGTGIQAGIVVGITAGLLVLLQDELAKILKELVPNVPWDWNSMRDRITGKRSGGPASGLTMVGEGGPELLRLPAGSHVFSNGASRAMLQGGGNVTTNVYVTIQAGIGDPVAIGREVDRVLRVYRKRAGIPVAGAMA